MTTSVSIASSARRSLAEADGDDDETHAASVAARTGRARRRLRGMGADPRVG
jgi:hypothetical protein